MLLLLYIYHACNCGFDPFPWYDEIQQQYQLTAKKRNAFDFFRFKWPISESQAESCHVYHGTCDDFFFAMYSFAVSIPLHVMKCNCVYTEEISMSHTINCGMSSAVSKNSFPGCKTVDIIAIEIKLANTQTLWIDQLININE